MSKEQPTTERRLKKESLKARLFLENPYDIETFFESLSIASDNGKELQFIDKLVAHIRLGPEQELTDVCYKTLRDLKIIDII